MNQGATRAKTTSANFAHQGRRSSLPGLAGTTGSPYMSSSRIFMRWEYSK